MSQPGCLPMPSFKLLSRITSNRKSSRMAVQAAAAEECVETIVEEKKGERQSSSFTLGVTNENARPEHLVILVNGIAGSAENWRFVAEQFKEKLADKVVVHCSATNSALKTLNGVDVMGNRLAEEVMSVIDDTPGVTKISFLGHSLGGLIARYAIGQLYAPPGGKSLLQERSETKSSDMEAGRSGRKENDAILSDTETEGNGREDISASCNTPLEGTVAGLEPVNFITIATPHLGCRGKQNLPFLFGIASLERVAPLVSHWFVGRTGRHLFLADGDKPLLQRMVTDCDEGRFLSALRSFKRRTAYANVENDRMVGWRTASIRREREMPELDGRNVPLEEMYPHVVGMAVIPNDEDKDGGSESKTALAADAIEEEMVCGLQQVSWTIYDVSFKNAKKRNDAHNLIQVKIASIHSEGKDVIYHILDKHF